MVQFHIMYAINFSKYNYDVNIRQTILLLEGGEEI